MKRSVKPAHRVRAVTVPPPATACADRPQGDDELEIRFSLTALGELAVASGERSRGRRFRGFGPCGAVA